MAGARSWRRKETEGSGTRGGSEVLPIQVFTRGWKGGHSSTTCLRHHLAKSTIDITPMTNRLYNDAQGPCINFINDAVISNPQAVQTLGALQFCCLRRKRIRRQAIDASDNAGDNSPRDRLQVFFDGWFVVETIEGHASGAASSSRRQVWFSRFDAQLRRQDPEDRPSDGNIV